MDKFLKLAAEKDYQVGAMTVDECIDIATAMGWSFGETTIAEARVANKMSREEVTSAVIDSFCHNLYALDIGLSSGASFLMGKLGKELASGITLSDDPFVDKVLRYTLAAQVGNHSVGLQPCAGTGDACTFTGLMKALGETVEDKEKLARLVASMLKIGTIFRVGKTTTGCNMEGFGAGAAATAAVVAELIGGTPEQVGKAIVLALSPTIGTPCTPRVMVSGLCSTHLGGGVTIGCQAANLAVKTSIPVMVPPDVMIAMATAVHPVSAKHIVPVVIRYMEPFFKTHAEVEEYVPEDVKQRESSRISETISAARQEARALSAQANSIIKPFGDAVVGGSSQAVGSPTNAARIAHALARGEVTGVKIELYPELFARRGINIPGILMAAVYGAATDNAQLYREIMDKVKTAGITVEMLEVDEPQMQRITVFAKECNSMVESLNRGGARLVLRKASPSLKEAQQAAQKLNIEVVS